MWEAMLHENATGDLLSPAATISKPHITVIVPQDLAVTLPLSRQPPRIVLAQPSLPHPTAAPHHTRHRPERSRLAATATPPWAGTRSALPDLMDGDHLPPQDCILSLSKDWGRAGAGSSSCLPVHPLPANSASSRSASSFHYVKSSPTTSPRARTSSLTSPASSEVEVPPVRRTRRGGKAALLPTSG